MANDAFMTPEIPQPVRGLMKLSIEQARRLRDLRRDQRENLEVAGEQLAIGGVPACLRSTSRSPRSCA